MSYTMLPRPFEVSLRLKEMVVEQQEELQQLHDERVEELKGYEASSLSRNPFIASYDSKIISANDRIDFFGGTVLATALLYDDKLRSLYVLAVLDHSGSEVITVSSHKVTLVGSSTPLGRRILEGEAGVNTSFDTIVAIELMPSFAKQKGRARTLSCRYDLLNLDMIKLFDRSKYPFSSDHLPEFCQVSDHLYSLGYSIESGERPGLLTANHADRYGFMFLQYGDAMTLTTSISYDPILAADYLHLFAYLNFINRNTAYMKVVVLDDMTVVGQFTLPGNYEKNSFDVCLGYLDDDMKGIPRIEHSFITEFMSQDDE